MEKNENLIEVRGLVLRFFTYEGVVRALEGIALDIRQGETLGLVGETGCGKSVTALSTIGIVLPPGRIIRGDIRLRKDGKEIDILKLSEKDLQKIRGEDISIVFQEPRAALNPIFTVKDQIGEVLLLHRREELCEKVLKKLEKELKNAKGFRKFILNFEKGMYQTMKKNPKSLKLRIASKIPILRRFQNPLKDTVKEEVVRILEMLRIPDPQRVAEMYPHELSGGMAQRVVIAMALACNPVLLIADEPTTNLDVTVQAQILHWLRELKKEFKSSILYITHDLGVVAELCDRVAVMYAGNVVEVADVYTLFKNPLHPYTRGLLESIPRPGSPLKSIPGTVPNLINPPPGCRFHTRCCYAMPICSNVKPKLVEVEKDHRVACHLFPQGGSQNE